MVEPSAIDRDYLLVVRDSVARFVKRVGEKYTEAGRLLDIAPQNWPLARKAFRPEVWIDTLDIDSTSGATFVADICQDNSVSMPAGTYDYVLCTEVLEHTKAPFDAVREIRRLLKKGGLLFLSVPFNLRIHGPLPDCWRFTEHGLRVILRGFEILELNTMETPGRPLMPIHYTVVAAKCE